jgi:hypothetical protein
MAAGDRLEMRIRDLAPVAIVRATDAVVSCDSGGWSLFADDSVFFRPDGASASYRGRLAGGVLTAVTPDGPILRFAR